METIYLSERNLRVLLSKLERKKSGDKTECSIIKYKDINSEYKNSMSICIVIAIQDSQMYENREPGYMSSVDVT